MPFQKVVRERLAVLKEEFNAGILPQALYEDMCRGVIAQFGNSMFDEGAKTGKQKPSKEEERESDYKGLMDRRKYNRGANHRRSYS